MSGFELWAYRGLIAILGAIIIFWLKRYIGSQDEKNKLFFEALKKFDNSITKLTDTLESRDKICDLKHSWMDKRMEEVEEKLHNLKK